MKLLEILIAITVGLTMYLISIKSMKEYVNKSIAISRDHEDTLAKLIKQQQYEIDILADSVKELSK